MNKEKQERPELFTLAFWQHAITQMVHAGVAGLAGPLVANQAGLITSVPWYAMWSSAGAGVILSFAASLGSLTLPNRLPASFIKETEAELEAERVLLREERIRQERRRLRGRGEEILVTPENPVEPAHDPDFLITGHPPERTERAVRQQYPTSHYPPQQLPHVYADEVEPEPPPRQRKTFRRGETSPGTAVPQEDWPQGGRRGKESK